MGQSTYLSTVEMDKVLGWDAKALVVSWRLVSLQNDVRGRKQIPHSYLYKNRKRVINVVVGAFNVVGGQTPFGAKTLSFALSVIFPNTSDIIDGET